MDFITLFHFADILISDPSKNKDDNVLGQMLPTTSTSISAIDMDSESLSQIMDSIKSPSPSESELKRGNSPGNSANTESARGDDRFSKTGTPYISPVREHLSVAHCMDGGTASAGEKHSLSLDDSKSIDSSVAFKDTLSTIDLMKSRPSDMTREIEIKIENPTEFLPEQITQSSSHDDIDVMPAALTVEKKYSSSTSKSGSDSTKKSKSSDSGDPSISKSSSSGSSRSSKSNKKSKHAKVESSKKSSKSSSKSDKSKSNDADTSKSTNETASASTANPSSSSSSKKSKDSSSRGSSRKRILKPTKRPHRTFYNSSQVAKRSMLNLETLASLMKRPNLSVRNHDIIAECGDTPQSLYDFSTWEAWMNHPVKRFKPGERFTSRAIFKELQELYAKQNVRLADFKNNPPNSVESKSVSDGLHTSDEDIDQDYYNDSGSVSKKVLSLTYLIREIVSLKYSMA